MLPDTHRMKFDLYQHEIICADVCTAYWGKFERWTEPVSDQLSSLKLEPDRYMKLEGLNIFLEIDRGSENPGVIWDKMQKYRAYSQLLRQPFHVVFVIQDYSKHLDLKTLVADEREAARISKQRKRTDLIGKLTEEAECGNMFLYTCQDWIMKYPLQAILASPMGQPFSFQTLSELYK